MTLQSSTSADKNNNLKYLLGTLKRSWTQCVINFVVTFFLGPVLLLLVTNSYTETIYRNKNIPGLVNTIGATYSFYCVIAAILAVISAIVAFNYLNSRVSVNFYHSLPFKRTRMFLTNYISGIFSFVVGFGLNYLICIIIPAACDMGFSECFPVITSVFLNSLLYFVFIYSLTVLIGMTTGLAAVGWLMTIAAVAILPAIKLCLNALKGFYSSNFWIDYFLEYEKFLPTSPVVILFDNKAFSFKSLFVILILTAAFTVGALVLYHYRLSEKSGNPFVFTRFASFVKYAIMFPVSMGFAIIFGYMGDSNFFWVLFGSVSGSVLAWMVMNSIIAKSARSMFTAVKGMIIFTVIVTLFNSCLTLATEPVDNFILEHKALVSSVSVEIDGYGKMARYTFKDDENIDALLEIINDSKSDGLFGSGYADAEIYDKYYEKEYNVKIDGKEYYIGQPGTDRLRVRAAVKTYFGYEIARSFSITDSMLDANNNLYNYFEELEKLANSEEYKNELLAKIDAVDESYRFYVTLEPNMIKDGKIKLTRNYDTLDIINNYSNNRYIDEYAELIEAYRKDALNISFEHYNAPVIGEMQLRDNNYSSYVYLPITVNFTNTLEYLKECGIINSVDYAYDVAQAIDTVYIYDYYTDKVMTVKNEAEKLQIFKSVDTYDMYTQYSSYFNTVDHRYRVFYSVEVIEEHYYNKSESYDFEVMIAEAHPEVQYATESSINTGTARCEFISGKVPVFVEAYFAR